jgi:multiple sugar transport system ATP-binding protein
VGDERNMSSLQLKNLTLTYPDGFRAVRGLDVSVEDGEFFTIVGPSGCGKTTVLRLVAGLEDPTSGEILIDGVRVNELGPRGRDIAFAFQQYALYPYMSVAENLAFSLRVAGVRPNEIRRRVDDVARLLEISELLDRRPSRLSGGQQQRVALGRSLIREPRVLLMDEPMSNLDAALRVQGRAELLMLQRRLGTTTLYVTHDQTEAMAMADRIAVMRDGEVVQCGPPMEVYSHPADMFVAQAVGSPPMSIVRAVVERRDDNLILRLGSHSVPIDDTVVAQRPALDAMDGRQVGVGLRPEMLHRDERGPIAASVAGTELHGGDRLLSATIDARSVNQRLGSVCDGVDRHSTIATFVDAHADIDPWKPLRLRVDLGDVHLFDLSTGARIETSA